MHMPSLDGHFLENLCFEKQGAPGHAVDAAAGQHLHGWAIGRASIINVYCEVCYRCEVHVITYSCSCIDDIG